MKHVNFKFPEPKKGIVICDFTVEAADDIAAVGKLNDYLTELKKLFFRPPTPVGDSNDPKVIGQECMSRLRMITDPIAFVVTVHLFTEQWLNQIFLRFCPHRDLTDYTYYRKLEICSALGKLTEDLFFNLRKLNRLRNSVAHDLNFDLTKMELDYRGCLPNFELTEFRPSFHYEAEQHHISNVLLGVMSVTYMLLHQHCVTTLGFKCSAKSGSITESGASQPG